MLREPREDLLRRVGGDEHIRWGGESYPLADVRPQRFRLLADYRSGTVRSGRCRAGAGGGESEALQDPARVVGREVGAIEARGARQDLLRRKTTARHHDVVPVHGVGQATADGALYVSG